MAPVPMISIGNFARASASELSRGFTTWIQRPQTHEVFLVSPAADPAPVPPADRRSAGLQLPRHRWPPLNDGLMAAVAKVRCSNFNTRTLPLRNTRLRAFGNFFGCTRVDHIVRALGSSPEAWHVDEEQDVRGLSNPQGESTRMDSRLACNMNMEARRKTPAASRKDSRLLYLFDMR